MKTITAHRVKQLTLLLVAVSALGGCAVYTQPAPAYYYGDSGSAPVYVAPPPVYVAPAPVYVGPPIFFGFGFRGGHHYHGRGGRWR